MIIFKYMFYTSILLIIITYSYGNENETNTFRLFKTVIPTKYDLRIETSLYGNSFAFTTTVVIQIKCIKPTKLITLHARGLKVITRNTKFQSWDRPYNILKITTDEKYDFLNIQLDNSLRANNSYRLTLRSKGKPSDRMTGYYHTSYGEESNAQTKWLTLTHFEPTYARTVFPCFDEPGFKAQFQISMLHENELTALSNMPLKKSVKIDSNTVLDIFEESYPMSTYLVAFMLTNFEAKHINLDDVSINIWARKEILPQVEFALNILPKLLEYYNKYFDVKYSLKKLDIVALPDFPRDAMENWGLIFFRESSLLLDINSSSIYAKEEITYVVAHKLAQQWLGNMVTMKWWQDTWIKEGLSSFFATLAISYVFPRWNYYRIKVLNNVQTVLSYDAYVSSRPISKSISSSEDIEQQIEFNDGLSYKKVSFLIRQLEQQLTPDKFRKGISTLIKKYKFRSISEEGLWYTLSEYARSTGMLSQRSSYHEMMTPWTVHPGFPLVSVGRNYDEGRIRITQNRYLINNAMNYDTCYWTPLSYVTELQTHYNSTLANLWLKCPKTDITFDVNNMTDKWILFNNHASGLYRVSYDETNWNMLVDQLNDKHQKIDETNRVLLIDDVMKLAMTGYVTYGVAFNLLDYIIDEEKYMPWKTAIDNFYIILSYVENTPNYNLLKKYILSLLSPCYEKYGGIDVPKQNGEMLKFHELILKTACNFNLQGCLVTTTNLFSSWMNKNISIPSHIREVVFCIGVKYGGEKEWNFLWRYYVHSDIEVEKQEMLTALGCSRDVSQLSRYLQLAIATKSGMKPQNVFRVLRAVTKNHIGTKVAREFIYEYIKSNYNKIEKDILITYLKIIAEVLKSEDEFTEFKYFILQYFKNQTDEVKKIMEDIVLRKFWQQTYSSQINEILTEKNNPKPEDPKKKRKKKVRKYA